MNKIKEGDIVYTRINNLFYPYRIVKIDENPEIFHVVMYKPLKKAPVKNDIKDFEVYIQHLPLNKFTDYEFIDHEKITKDDLKGYYDFLKITNFRRYIDETGQKLEEVVNSANTAYIKANQLKENNKLREAIELYSYAINIFPLFFEAVDNRGLTKMALGDFKGAIEDFRFSLEIKDDNIVAAFCIGECLYQLKEYKQAEEQFKKCLEIDPDDALSREWLEKTREQQQVSN